MNKELIKNKEDFDSFLESVHEKDQGSLKRYPPQDYPCVIVSNCITNPNGRDWTEYEIVYLKDFQD